MCSRITDTVSRDTVGRLGGDEFVVLIDDLRMSADATRVAERIQIELAKPFDLAGQEVFISGSIGITLSESAYERPEDLLRDADTAMYRAKSAGKARHEMFDANMHAEAVERLSIESHLRGAIARNELRNHYQPIVRCP